MELWNEDGSRNEAAFKLMREAIDWSRGAHLRVILDMHVLRSHHFNAANEGGTNPSSAIPRHSNTS
jgi:endoglucanase